MAELRGRLSADSFETWLSPVQFLDMKDDALVLRVPNRFFADWIATHYASLILEALSKQVKSAPTKVQWEIDEALQEQLLSARQAELNVGSNDRYRDEQRTSHRAERRSPHEPEMRGEPTDVIRTEGRNESSMSDGHDDGAPFERRQMPDRRASNPSQSAAHGSNGESGHQPSNGASSTSSFNANRESHSSQPIASQLVGGQALGSTSSGRVSSAQRHGNPPSKSMQSTPVASRPSHLSPKYSFDNFVVGPSNQLAHAASVAVGSSPGRRYNPFFIYGGVGLGKTHLVNAIGHRILADDPSVRILYLSAEHFTNEFIWALQNHRINEFRERYRTNCDVILMDDIQFLAGRDQTQEEFFHTFNALYHRDKQIVVTSDVYPQLIPEMEERLVSRFQSGMVADIQAPELDTRIAILQKKAEAESIELPSDVALFVAQVVKSNVRELEGTLLRVAVQADLCRRPIDLELAKHALQAVVPVSDQATTVEDVQKAVCEYFSLRLADLKSKRRHRAVSFPRMVAMYICRQRLSTSYPELGERFGGKDHTTVINAVRKIERQLKDGDLNTRSALDALERKLGF